MMLKALVPREVHRSEPWSLCLLLCNLYTFSRLCLHCIKSRDTNLASFCLKKCESEEDHRHGNLMSSQKEWTMGLVDQSTEASD